MSYIPKRLIDMNLLINMSQNNPLVKDMPTRLIAYDIPIITNTSLKVFKIEKQIENIKSGGFKKIGPNLLNGILFIIVCLIIYSVLHYKYYKKKESQIKIHGGT
jgi:hypothetical protein